MTRFRAGRDDDIDEFTLLVMERFRERLAVAHTPTGATTADQPVDLPDDPPAEPSVPTSEAEPVDARQAPESADWISAHGPRRVESEARPQAAASPDVTSRIDVAHRLDREHGEGGSEPIRPPDERVEGSACEPTALLGEVLVARGAVSESALADALAVQPASGKRLGELLVEAGVLSERDLVSALAEQLSMQTVDLRRVTPEREVVALLAESAARDLSAVPLRRGGDRIEVAVADPRRAGLPAALVEAIESPLRLFLAPESEVLRTIDVSYRTDARVDDVVRVFEERARLRADQERARSNQSLATVDENAPAVQVVNLILEQAVKDRASDVHIEPAGDCVRIRNRTDGALHDVFTLPASMSQSLVSRIKVMAELNIVERRRPQDGQIEVTIDGRELDVRVSTTCTVDGEKVVLRLLDKSRALHPLHELGMSDDLFAGFYDLVRSPFGMVICAGPTGSGKTTTLYATLSEINRTEINVMTIEDPIEFVHRHKRSVVSQREVGWDTDSFARGLRAALREDPDVVLVGEMRDPETIGIALTVAETGHLVFATLHTNDAPQAVDRMIDVFPAEQQSQVRVQLSASLQVVVAQRLLPRVAGGQVAAFEVLMATNPIRNLIREGKTHQIRNLLATGGRDGMVAMEASLSRLVADGVVTLEEAAARSTRPDDIRA